MSYVEQEHNCNRAIKHILLIGDDGISNQFIIQEINKSGYFSFERKCLQEINKSTKTISSDLVLISYLTLEKVIDIQVTLSQVLSNKWIIYDFPKEIGEMIVAETQLMYLIDLKGIIYQDAPIEHFTRCLKSVIDGDLWLPRKVMTEMITDIRPYALQLQAKQTHLTKREIQIFKLVIKGASNREISEDLFIAECTVKTHVYNIYKKLKVNNRKEAIQKASFIYDKILFTQYHH